MKNLFVTILLVLIAIIILEGCALNQLSGGYNYCEKHDVIWHTAFGESHKCKWGAVVKDRDGNIKTVDSYGESIK